MKSEAGTRVQDRRSIISGLSIGKRVNVGWESQGTKTQHLRTGQ